MTNGEKIIAILKPRKDQIRIYDNWVEIEIQKLGINFSCELDWWNTECNEPTTKNDLGIDCINRQAAITFVCKNIKEILKDTTPLEVKLSDDYIYENVAKIMRNPKVLPSVTPQKPALEKDGTLIVTTEHYKNVGRVLVQCGTNGTLFYQDQEPEIVPVAVVKFDEDKLREIVQEKVDEIKENLIEQYLDKITAEIEEAQTYEGIYIDRAYVLEIIDKYKAESEKNKLC